MQTAHTLLARNGVAHRWIDTATDPLGGLLVEYCGLGVERPVAVFADGSQLPAPVDFVEPDPERNDEGPEQAHAAEGRRIGMTVPARTPAQRAIAEAFLASTEWRSELSRRPGCTPSPTMACTTSS
jgi:hypothetical protein